MIGAMTPEFFREAIGIRKLTSELITQAIRDLTSKNKKIRKGAEEFISSKEFAIICYDLNVCPQRIRKQALQLAAIKPQKNAPSSKEPPAEHVPQLLDLAVNS